MKNIIGICLLLFLSCSSYCQIKWTKFTAPDHSFSILFPDTPKESISVDTTEGILATVKMYMTNLVDNKFVFLAGTTDYSASYKFTNDAELNANRDNFCKSANVKLINTTQIKYANKYPGIEFTAKNEQLFFKCLVYIVNRRPYIIVAGSVRTETSTPELDKFLSSFTLLL